MNIIFAWILNWIYCQYILKTDQKYKSEITFSGSLVVGHRLRREFVGGKDLGDPEDFIPLFGRTCNIKLFKKTNVQYWIV